MNDIRYEPALNARVDERLIIFPNNLPLSATNVTKQLDEWLAIKHNTDGTALQKAVMHIVYPITVAAVPVVAIVPVVIARVGYGVALRNHTLSRGVPDREPYICAEELLRHYYNGHESLGVGKVDGAVAKGSRMMHLRSRHHAGTIQRTFKEYQNKLEQCRAEFGENPSVELLNRRGPELLLLSLQEQLIARGKTLNLRGALVSAIYVIQDRCQINVINLETINANIAQANAQRQAPAASSSSSFWGGLKKLNPFGSSSRPENDSDDEENRTFDL